MSSIYSSTSKRLFSLCQRIFRNQSIGSRTLYSPAALGLENYNNTREKTKLQFNEMESRFRNKMHEFVAPESINMVFTEDLKNMLYLAEATEEDLELLEKMILKFNEQNKSLRFGSFIFGPVVMRTYHTLNKPNEAFQLFMNPALNEFFDQLGTYQILLNLLFINGMYDEMQEVTNIVIKKQYQAVKYPKNVVVLAMAGCYKKNTPESLKYAINLWDQLQKSGHLTMRRAVTFAAALAINQGSPHIALEMMSTLANQNYVTVRNLKVSALTDLNRLDDALPILRGVLGIDSGREIKHTFHKEVMDKIKAAVEKTDKKDVIQEFQRIYEQLHTQGHIVNETLDSQLCSEIELNPQQNSFHGNRMLAASFETRRPRDYKRFVSRPGLKDMI